MRKFHLAAACALLSSSFPAAAQNVSTPGDTPDARYEEQNDRDSDFPWGLLGLLGLAGLIPRKREEHYTDTRRDNRP